MLHEPEAASFGNDRKLSPPEDFPAMHLDLV